ncbi:MAG: VCBS repeat-containing protein [Clostridia bacterium]
MRNLLILLCVFMCFSMTGCSLTNGIDVQALMEPPKSNDDQESIYSLIEADDGEFDLVYPKRGDYRAAIIMEDFNADGTEEAMAFYANPDGGIYLKFMSKKDDTWSTVSVFTNSSVQVDKVEFGDLDGDGSLEIIVGWGSSTSLSATISVYSFEDYKYVENILEYNYNEFLLVDLNSDEIQEIFTTSIFTASEIEENPDTLAMARVYRFEEKPLLYLSCELSSLAVRYNTCTFGSISETQDGVIVEAITAEGGLVTQVVCIKNNILTSLFSSEDLVLQYNYFNRSSGISIESQDVNDDGIFEYPYVTVQNGTSYTYSINSYNYYVDWLSYNSDDKTFELVQRDIVFIDDGFRITVDPEVDIVCELSQNSTYVVSERVLNTEGELVYTKTLLTIKVFTSTQWEALNSQSDYEIVIKSENNMVYVVENSSYMDDDIKDSITLLS